MISDDILKPYLDAINSDDPEGRLLRLVVDLKNKGGTQEEAEELVYQAGVTSGVWGKRDERDAAVEAVLHCIGGYCSLGNHIFAEDFDEKNLYRVLPPSLAPNAGGGKE